MVQTPSEIVILIHGLARTSRSMSKMGRALASTGFCPVNLRYPSRKYPLKTLAEDFLLPQIIEVFSKSRGTVHFVTHSMGGVLLRFIFRKFPTEKIGKTVMLAPPNHGSEIVDKLKKHKWFRSFFGPATLELGTGAEFFHKNRYPLPPRCGIIAGDRSVFHIFDSVLPKPHDGTVSVASTKETGSADHIVLHTSHPFIMVACEVIANTIDFLQSGKFPPKD